MLTRLCAATLLLSLLVACGDDSTSAADQEVSSTSANAPESATASATASATPTPTPTASEPAPSRTASSNAKPSTPAKAGTRIAKGSSQFGPMLFDGTGQAIYLFDVESTSKPECYGYCAAAWPPVLTKGDPVAGPGVNAALLATTKRTDGTTQVTYNDHPLYFYAHEAKGVVKCHDIFLNGGNWYVVQPGGDAAPPG